MSAPRPGSRKASVYDKWQAEGTDAAMTLGSALGLSVGTVRSWIGSWSKKGKVIEEVDETPVRERKASRHFYETSYPYDRPTEARRAADRICERQKMDKDVYAVVKHPTEERWAFIPRHSADQYGIELDIPTFRKGDRVYAMTATLFEGTVIEAGPEVCHVRWDKDGTRTLIQEFMPNYYLRHIPKKGRPRVQDEVRV